MTFFTPSSPLSSASSAFTASSPPLLSRTALVPWQPGDQDHATPAGACLPVLLSALHWNGAPRDLSEALTVPLPQMTAADLHDTLANLHIITWTRRTRLDRLDPRLLPCLFVPDRGAPLVVLDADESGLHAYDGGLRQSGLVARHRLAGEVSYFAFAEEGDERLFDPTAAPFPSASGTFSAASPDQTARSPGWTQNTLRRFERLGWRLLGLTLPIHLMALAVPLAVLAMADYAVAQGEPGLLLTLALGAGLSVVAEAILRGLRHRLVAHISGRLDMIFGGAVLSALLRRPLAPRDHTPGPPGLPPDPDLDLPRVAARGMALLDLPFAGLYLLVLTLIAGPLVSVPVLLILLLAVIMLGARPWLLWISTGEQEHRLGLHVRLIEALVQARAIKAEAADSLWRARLRDASARHTLARRRRARLAATCDIIGDLLPLLAGGAIVALWLPRTDTLSLGVLLAALILSGQALTPVRRCFAASLDYLAWQIRMHRFDRLMAAATDYSRRPPGTIHVRRFVGRIMLEGVVVRYHPDLPPALETVTLGITPGETVAINGPLGAGSSTLLKAVAGLVLPERGMVTVDGLDLRQLDPAEIRRAIAYLPSVPDLFTGSIADNLRLVHPAASNNELCAALMRAGILATVEALPAGLNTPIAPGIEAGGEDPGLPLPVRRALTLARVWLADANIILLDDPFAGLDHDGETHLIGQLKALRGKATVLLTGVRPALLARLARLTDRVVMLEHGRLTFNGTPEQWNVHSQGGGQ